MSVMSTHPGSIDAAIPAASWFWAGVIRIDDALGGAARCRHVALCERGIGAFEVIVFPALVDLQGGLNRSTQHFILEEKDGV